MERGKREKKADTSVSPRAIPLSELPHRGSEGLDRMGSQETAELFSSTERECLEALLLPDTLAAAQSVVESWIDKPPGRLLLGGAGTSGRLAWYLVERHRSNLATLGVELHAWIAGGPGALVLAVEGAEDDFEAAYSEFRSGIVDDTGFYVGISCGLSAPCVAAGLVAATDLGARSAVFGVNTADEARSTPLPRLDGGFRGCLSAREDDPSFTLISAPVGPELLTGSSRLKGGTATWVLLDAMLSAWIDADAPGLEGRIRAAFSEAAGIASQAGPWIESAGECLRRGRSLFYLGRGDEGRAGLLDASECGPTFGARADQIRAFLEGGWAELGAETSNDSPPISRIAFDQGYQDKLQAGDLVFVLGEVECEVPATKIVLPVSGFLPTKLLLNAISTGAFVRSGKVWGNRMIDLALSNHKLFDRACRILEDLRGKPADACYRSLVAAIWGQERPDRDLLRLPAEAHLAQVRAQGGATGYVPLALLHLEGMPLSQARAALDAQPVLRNLLIG